MTTSSDIERAKVRLPRHEAAPSLMAVGGRFVAVRDVSIGDKAVIVVDGLVPGERLGDIHSFCESVAYLRYVFKAYESPSSEVVRGRQWVHLVEPAEARHLPVEDVAALVGGLYPSKALSLARCHINCIPFGESRVRHVDDFDGKVIEAVYFANREWRPNWAGELQFFDGDEVVRSIYPKPGRVVVFDATLLHRGGVPALSAPFDRYAVAMRFDVE